jgi:hypothetical protein
MSENPEWTVGGEWWREGERELWEGGEEVEARRRRDYACQVEMAAELWSRKDGTNEDRVAMVADLRAAAARYPADVRLRELITELLTGSESFAEFWAAGSVGPHTSSRKLIHHPQVGTMELDCDVLTVPGSDLRIVAYTAEPGTEAADRLALLAVVGQQSFA